MARTWLGFLRKNRKHSVFGIASAGDSYAQFRLGNLFLVGEGVVQDDEMAFEYLHKAALQGEVDAQFPLGGLYAVGRGVPQDHDQALEWWDRAAEAGDIEAAQNAAQLC